MSRDPRRELPAVDRLLGDRRVAAWSDRWGERHVKRALRATLASYRERLGAGELEDAPSPESILADASERLRVSSRPSLRPVLNGTGVVLHTNLGRAPLPPEALEAMDRIGRGYSNLEFDLEVGGRGSRHVHCVDLLRELTGGADALVVNNNAAAVALAVNELARGREVLVSRGEMVEIGGSFRIPEVVERSGARLRGVGTTNRTRLEDYRDAIGEETGAILRVHPSNYAVRGFAERVALESLVALGREHAVPVVHDLGSGLLTPEPLEGFPAEPTPSGSLEAGSDLVTWSGDKLLGGPQAGVVAGTETLVSRLRRNPLLRAFRVDKTTLAALEATLRLYRDPETAASRIPALARLTESAESVRDRADRALAAAGLAEDAGVTVERLDSMVGGGAYPEHRIPSAGWVVEGVAADEVDARCREGDPPLVGRISDGAFRVDVRTLAPGEEETAARTLAAAVADVRSRRA